MNFQIVEGVSAVWHYHLAHADASPATSLCGARTMATSAPLKSWGFRPAHFRSSYCETCASMAGLEQTSPDSANAR